MAAPAYPNPPALRIRPVGYDHPDAVELIRQVQLVYLERYGGEDSAPIAAAEFVPPVGLFLLGYADLGAGEIPVASGAWRAQDGPAPEFRPGDAEVKRMFVVEAARGRGFARAMLAELEHAAVRAGRRRIVLETGTMQPEAVALYRSSGYTDIPAFGYYRNEPKSIHLAKPLPNPDQEEPAWPSTP